jgi:hypothetical protein
MHDHWKFASFGPVKTPRELWQYGFSWTHRHYRNFEAPGFVPADMPTAWAASKAKGNRFAAELVKRHLWDEVPGGWVYHDWIDYASPDERRYFGVAADEPGDNPPERETLQDKRRRAGAAGGRASGATRRQTAETAKQDRSTAEASASAQRSKAEAHASPPNPNPEPDASAVASSGTPTSADATASEAHASTKRSTDGAPTRLVPAVAQQEPSGRPAVLAGVADELVAEYATNYSHTLPRKLRQQLLQQCDTLLGEGLAREQVRAGLVLLWQRPNAGPGLLPNLVHEAAAGPPPAAANGQATGRPMSAAARRKAGIAAARAKAAAKSGAQPQEPLQTSVFPLGVDVVEGQVVGETA